MIRSSQKIAKEFDKEGRRSRIIMPPVSAAHGDVVHVCGVVSLALNGADGVRVVVEQKDARRCARAEVRQRLVRVVLRAGAEEHGAQRE